MPDPEVIATPVQVKVSTKQANVSKRAASNRHKKKKRGKRKAGTSQRTRTVRPYPASSFEEALPLAEAIHEYASSEKVRRLTLLKHLEKSPTSSSTMMLITNSTKYGLTKGSYAADWLELTEIGSIASNPASPPREKLKARFDLAIEGVAPFQKLYSEFKGKRLPSHDVLKDVLLEGKFEIDKPTECVDLFIVNAKYLGLLQTIAGSETLIPIEQALDELGNGQQVVAASTRASAGLESVMTQVDGKAVPSKVDWSKTCFVITPIGDEGTETRKHADLFLSALIEPALREFGLGVIRARQDWWRRNDHIADP